MPMGSANRSSGTDRPVTALKEPIKKSAYLKMPSSAAPRATLSHIHSFFRLGHRSMARPQP